MKLACEDGNIKLVEISTVADVGAEKRVDESLVQTWKLKFPDQMSDLSNSFVPFKSP